MLQSTAPNVTKNQSEIKKNKKIYKQLHGVN
jgi:hypothetical protein